MGLFSSSVGSPQRTGGSEGFPVCSAWAGRAAQAASGCFSGISPSVRSAVFESTCVCPGAGSLQAADHVPGMLPTSYSTCVVSWLSITSEPNHRKRKFSHHWDNALFKTKELKSKWTWSSSGDKGRWESCTVLDNVILPLKAMLLSMILGKIHPTNKYQVALVLSFLFI